MLKCAFLQDNNMLKVIIHLEEHGKIKEIQYDLENSDATNFHLSKGKGYSFYLRENFYLRKNFILMPLFGLESPEIANKKDVKITYIEILDNPENTIDEMIQILEYKGYMKWFDAKKISFGIINQPTNRWELTKKFFIRYLFEVNN